MPNLKDDKRTELFEILKRCREGLNLPAQNHVESHYTADSLVSLFRFLDEKLYRIEIKEVIPTEPKNEKP